jgi:hypothetical protein
MSMDGIGVLYVSYSADRLVSEHPMWRMRPAWTIKSGSRKDNGGFMGHPVLFCCLSLC